MKTFKGFFPGINWYPPPPPHTITVYAQQSYHSLLQQEKVSDYYSEGTQMSNGTDNPPRPFDTDNLPPRVLIVLDLL